MAIITAKLAQFSILYLIFFKLSRRGDLMVMDRDYCMVDKKLEFLCNYQYFLLHSTHFTRLKVKHSRFSELILKFRDFWLHQVSYLSIKNTLPRNVNGKVEFIILSCCIFWAYKLNICIISHFLCQWLRYIWLTPQFSSEFSFSLL